MNRPIAFKHLRKGIICIDCACVESENLMMPLHVVTANADCQWCLHPLLASIEARKPKTPKPAAKLAMAIKDQVPPTMRSVYSNSDIEHKPIRVLVYR